MSQSSLRKKAAQAGIEESPEEVSKRANNFALQKLMSKVWKKSHRIIRGRFDPKTREITFHMNYLNNGDYKALRAELAREPTQDELCLFVERVGIKVDSGISEHDSRNQAISGE